MVKVGSVKQNRKQTSVVGEPKKQIMAALEWSGLQEIKAHQTSTKSTERLKTKQQGSSQKDKTATKPIKT